MPPKRRVAKKAPASRSGGGGGGGPRQTQKQIINLSIGKGSSASSNEYRPPTIVQVQDHYAHEAMPTYSDRTGTMAGDLLEMQRQNNAENLAERRQLMDRQFTHGLILTGVSAAVQAVPLIKDAFNNSSEALSAGGRFIGAGRRFIGHAQSAANAIVGAIRGGQRVGGQPRVWDRNNYVQRPQWERDQEAFRAFSQAGDAPAAHPQAAASVAGPSLGGASPELAQSRVLSGGSGTTGTFRTPSAVNVRPRDLRPDSYDSWHPDEQRTMALRGLAEATRERRAGSASKSSGYVADIDRRNG